MVPARAVSDGNTTQASETPPLPFPWLDFHSGLGLLNNSEQKALSGEIIKAKALVPKLQNGLKDDCI